MQLILAFAVSLSLALTAEAQTRTVNVDFRVNSSVVDPAYKANARNLANLAEAIDSIGMDRVNSIEVVSLSSPEGSLERNTILSRLRAAAMKKYIAAKFPALGTRTTAVPAGESWNQFRALVAGDTLLAKTTVDRILSIIDSNADVNVKKARLKGTLGTDPKVGPVYLYLSKTYFGIIRNSSIVVNYSNEAVAEVSDVEIPEIEIPEIAEDADVKVPAEEVVDSFELAPIAIPTLGRGLETIMAVKTNLLYDAITAVNVEVEVPIGKHFSVAVEDVFPWWEFQKNKYALQNWEMGIEGRYWFKGWDHDTKKLRGLFGGVYGMSGRGDLQMDTKFCYQVHYWSAGLSVGYSIPLGRKQWGNLEFNIAAGYLNSDYQHYQPSSSYDVLVRDQYDSGRISYFGPTKAKISLVIPINVRTSHAKKEVSHE